MAVHIGKELKSLSKQMVLVAGDFMVDKYLQGQASRISPEAPVPVVHIQKTFSRLGGAGNVICNIASMGAHTRAVTEVGADADGDYLLAQIGLKGTDTQFINQSEQVQTIVKTRVIAQNQQLIRYDGETIQPVSKAYIQRLLENADALFNGVGVVILSDYGKGTITEEMAAFLIGEATKRGIPVTVDPKGSNYSKYTGATVCTPNLKELSEAAGGRVLKEEKAIYEAAYELCDRYQIVHMLVTRSEKGMSLLRRGASDKQDFPACNEREVLDVTGAGDTVIAVFSLALAAGLALEQCCKISNIAASVVVSKIGTATASLEEISQLLITEKGTSPRKIISWEEAAQILSELKADGKRIVFTNGCFDLVHAGHISSFRQAKAFGDVLILGVNSDASIRRLKGEKRPIVHEQARLALLEAIDLIDYILLFDEDTPEKLIQMLSPDVLVKGKDWQGKPVAGGDFVKQNGGKVELIELEQGLSTTAIIEKIRMAYGED